MELRRMVIAVIVFILILLALIRPVRVFLFDTIPELLGIEDTTCDRSSFYLCRDKEINSTIGETMACTVDEPDNPIGKCIPLPDTTSCKLRCGQASGADGEWVQSLSSQKMMCEEVQDRGIFKWWFGAEECYSTGFCFVKKGRGYDECLHCSLERANCGWLKASKRWGDNTAITEAQCTVCNDEFAEAGKDICIYDDENGQCVPVS